MSLACDTAVVASRVGGIPEIVVDGETGFLIDYDAGRPDAFSAALGERIDQLLDDPPRIGAKVQEEAEEVARAAREEPDERVDEEAADVLYHLTVLLHSRGRALGDAEEVLNGRRR